MQNAGSARKDILPDKRWRRRSVRWRCARGLPRVRPHRPSSSIQRRSVSGCTRRPSSSPKCSAASVGPKRSSTLPEYFSRTRAKTCWRSCGGLPRLENRPALPCRSAAGPPSRVTPSQSLGLPIAHLQQHRRVAQLKFAAHYACHDLHPPQLLLAHRCPRHRSLLNRPQSRGHF